MGLLVGGRVVVSKRMVLVAFGFGCLLFASVVAYNQAGHRMLRYSLDYLLSQTLTLKYKTENEHLDDLETDLAGYWQVRLDEESRDKLVLDARFGTADDADLAYYKRIFQENLALGAALDGYELHRGNITMGENSMCVDSPCNVAIFTKRGEETVYVGISKN